MWELEAAVGLHGDDMLSSALSVGASPAVVGDPFGWIPIG